jgi:diadenosine tetraphosphate (Ap4A) HIT family hydrolase
MGVRRLSFNLARVKPLGFLVGFALARFPYAIPAKTLIVTGEVVSFYHPVPYYKKHILIIPRKVIGGIIKAKKSSVLESVLDVAIRLSRQVAWDNKVAVLCVDGGKRQKVGQLHFHLHSVESAVSEEFLEGAKETAIESGSCTIVL